MNICLDLPQDGDNIGSITQSTSRSRRRRLSSVHAFPLFILLLLSAGVFSQVPAPKDVIGFTPGDDRKLASWNQVVEYFRRLDAASDRMMFEEIGKTTMGAPFVYATVSSPEILKNLEKYKQINAKLADPRKIGSRRTASAQLISEGKTIVLITFGIHSTEVGSTLSSMLIAHRLVSSNEPEIKNILENTIILLVPSLNPDGVDIVKTWYDKTLGTPYEGTSPPELYHKYVGHDNNRDWYAFSQIETQLTVNKIHNVWHPQIVHDVHQQGSNGSRLFLPPYMEPVEPNVPKEIVEGFTELGNYMAGDLRKKGFEGITTNTTYDAWTPARAYSHYHGGVRILSETASARLASPVTIKFEDLRGGVGGLDVKKESEKFGPLWKGGTWTIRDITKYMTSAAFSLMTHAADNRERWLQRFYAIGREAVRPRSEKELRGFFINGDQENADEVDEILRTGGVETQMVARFEYEGRVYTKGGYLVHLDQPYGGFAKALLESQKYPHLTTDDGQPVQPYDVTAHTLALLTNTEVVPIYNKIGRQVSKARPNYMVIGNPVKPCANVLKFRLYKSFVPSMDEGWTRWIFEGNGNAIPNGEYCGQSFASIGNDDIKGTAIFGVNTIIFPDQSPSQILNGYPKGSMPDEYTGGLGKEGVDNLKKFVESGGTLVFLNRSSDFAIEHFKLPLRDVTDGLQRRDFFIPGSILRAELDTTHPIAEGMPKESIAWFENSPAFEVIPAASGPTVGKGSSTSAETRTNPRAGDAMSVRIIARYPEKPENILLSGWALGAENIAGKAALVEVSIGKGKIYLFGFRPQYRGQSLATYPLLFNAIAR